MEKIHSQLLLEAGEELIGIYKTKKNSAWNTWSGASEGVNGGIALTNKRLLFYKKRRKAYELFNTISLPDIMSVTTGGVVYKHVLVNGLKFFPEGTNTQTLASLIQTHAQKARNQAPRVQTTPQQIQQIVNVNVPATAPTPVGSPAPTAPAKESLYCTQCGFQNDPDANFCKKCGAPIN